MATIKDSGTRRKFETGAQRDRAVGKGRMDLVPGWPIKLLSMHFEAGSFKYDENNWKKGIPLSVYLDSGERHLGDFKDGDRSEPHLISAFWNICCLIHTKHMIEQGLLPESLNDIEPFEDNPYPEIFEKLHKAATGEPSVQESALQFDKVPFNGGYFTLPLYFNWTGEFREPNKGDWFLSNFDKNGPIAGPNFIVEPMHNNGFTLYGERPILRKVSE